MNIPDYDGIGIYKITNPHNGKMYIGASRNVKKRIKEHAAAFKRNRGAKGFGSDASEYESFVVDVLEKIPYGNTEAAMLERERYYIEMLDTIRDGYNMVLNRVETLDCLQKHRARYANNPSMLEYIDELIAKKHTPIEEPNAERYAIKIGLDESDHVALHKYAERQGETISGYIKRLIKQDSGLEL